MASIIVFNAGSSSLKFKLFQTPELNVVASGTCSEIGSENSIFSWKIADKKSEESCTLKSHEDALLCVLKRLKKDKVQGLHEKDIEYVGHRVVHGGTHRKPVRITDKTLEELDKLTELAPLHNHRAANVMHACLKNLPKSENFAYFDTMFHSTVPEHIYTYPIPREQALKKMIRKWGFHGISYHYVINKVADTIGKSLDGMKVIAMHLGNGSSVCAIRNGQSFDTTMGLTPVSGLPGGTRSGDIDPSAVFHLVSRPDEERGDEFIHLSKAEEILNKCSGFKGLCGKSNMAEILELAKQDTEEGHDAQLTLDIFINRIQNYIGAYFVALEGVDAILFTGGIGEHAAPVREAIAAKLKCLGIQLDEKKNSEVKDHLSEKGVMDISSSQSSVRIYVVETNEELQIAQQLYHHISS
ncbi:acetate kinase [Radiomyces spectabilis]|uniref:acetate kinase n=1 Tax=Radiomyces spectabilis TaxID=64574 RepID=UPI0022207FA9|nr:acetate kinase [Radiomyces spectabilis]KAI8377822.1 acetate kinase [Radiomyces spectabilis]